MKVHIGWLIVTFVLSIGTTIAGCRFERLLTHMQEGSLAGETLANVSRALKIHKSENGTYPETLEGIEVEKTGGDYS